MALTQKQKQKAKEFLADVPEEHVFRCYDGASFKNMQELKNGLESMSDESFTHHSNMEKRDFSNWVRDVIGDGKLAKDLAKAANRTQAAAYVANRLAALSKRAV